MVSIVISDLIPLISILQLSVSTAIALIARLQFQWLSIKCNKPQISILIGGFDQQVGSFRWRWFTGNCLAGVSAGVFPAMELHLRVGLWDDGDGLQLRRTTGHQRWEISEHP